MFGNTQAIVTGSSRGLGQAIAEDFLNGLRAKGLEYTYYYDEDKYDFHLKNGDRSERVFQDRHYYLPLGVGRLADNPNLVENPGY